VKPVPGTLTRELYNLAVLLAAGAEQADIAAAWGKRTNAIAKLTLSLWTATRSRTTCEAVASVAIDDPTRFRRDVTNGRRILEQKLSAQISSSNGRQGTKANPLQNGRKAATCTNETTTAAE
jgi:hypothetical protein